MWSENCVISPGGFLGAVQKVAKIKDRTIFTGFAQNDLPEFVDFIIYCFHTAICREVIMNIKGNVENSTDELAKKCYMMMKNMYKKEFSEILSLFYGISISVITDLEGNVLNTTPEPFLMVNTPIPNKQNPSLKECLDLFTEQELLDGDNKYYNSEKKQHEEVYKKIKFWSFPDNLIIHLKRFSNNLTKNNILVDFPLDNLDLSPYVVGYNKKSFVYELYAICNHSGNVLGGHYTACVRNANGKWYLFNDTQIAEIPKSAMLKTSKAYCFFYRKKKTQ